MFKKILVPVDGSDSSWRALAAAKEMAEKFGGDLVVVTVTQPIDHLNLLVVRREFQDTLAELKEVSEKIISLAKMKLTGYEKKVDYVIKEGHPAECIVALAKEKECDSIVIGRRGLSGVEEFFLGSVSSNVAQQSVVPVVIVR
ncbi:MAG: universal stress protein [Acidaminococcaceae bacterium]|jgi:nucleotide-binding universal stress UspA family protein|nr:universal stress protein [Acidaminococcaceae bacterium]